MARGGRSRSSAARRALALALLLGALSAASAAARDAEPPERPERPRRIQLYVMPDTQSWAGNQGGHSLATWRAVVDALCRQRERFAMVLHTGDMVDKPRRRPEEWRAAQSVMKRLDRCGMPYAIAFGNHDFDEYPPEEGTKTLNDSRWKALRAELAYQPEERAPSGRTALTPLVPGWYVATLDYRLSREDLAWLDAEIAERPGARFLALDHACIGPAGLMRPHCGKVFERHPAIRIAVSGHWIGPVRDAWLRLPRQKGPPLIALFQNYQFVPDLAAWGVVIELEPESGDVCVWSENLLTGETGQPGGRHGKYVVLPGNARRCFDGSEGSKARAAPPPEATGTVVRPEPGSMGPGRQF
ncbi:MAG TPA: metallophosphoesterase [Myxococcota bacterium]